MSVHRRSIRSRPGRRWIVLICTATSAAGCSTPLSIFSRESEAAERVAQLAWFMTIVSALVFAAVIALMLLAIRRRRDVDPSAVDLSERGNAWLIWGGAVMPAILLVATFIVALGAMRRVSPPTPVLTIRVTGHQWWWELAYDSVATGKPFVTANELHIPADRPVRLLLTTADVIHSFWVPRLQGKLDLIPGDTNELYLEARHAGIYSGACAEYCGTQHANMMVAVIAEDMDTFRSWASNQSRLAATPRDSITERGERVFMSGACVGCHTVRGTLARGVTAPDLTHIGTRRTIAGGLLPNSPGNVAGWIANPQALKPGALMPTLRDFTGPDLRALAAYVSSLK